MAGDAPQHGSKQKQNRLLKSYCLKPFLVLRMDGLLVSWKDSICAQGKNLTQSKNQFSREFHSSEHFTQSSDYFFLWGMGWKTRNGEDLYQVVGGMEIKFLCLLSVLLMKRMNIKGLKGSGLHRWKKEWPKGSALSTLFLELKERSQSQLSYFVVRVWE